MQALRDSIQQEIVDNFVAQVCDGAYAIVEDYVDTQEDLPL